MIWRKQILMLPLLLLLHVHGMEKILEPVVQGLQGLELANNPDNSADGRMKYTDYHYEKVYRMMEKVKKRLTDEKDGILVLFKDQTKFDPENKPAQDSRKKCYDALDAIEEYFDAVGKFPVYEKGFKYLEEEAEYNDITTILSIASSMTDLQEGILYREKWDVTKLFQLNMNGNKRATLTSLTHDKYNIDYRRCLDKEAKGLEAFKVWSTQENQKCLGQYWDPEQEAKEDHVVQEGNDHHYHALQMDEKLTATINGKSKEVFYDPVQAANELSDTFSWISKTWFTWYNGAGAMKQYLDPNDMRYSLASLANFGSGQLFLLSTVLMAADSFRYLNIVMTNDGQKLIIPTIPTNNSIYLARNASMEAYHDLFVLSFIVAGTIAETAVIVNPLNNLPSCLPCIKDDNENKDCKRFLGSLISTTAIFGTIVWLAAFSFLLASLEHKGGAFKKFDETCYKTFKSAGMWTDFQCYETLAGQVMLFWLPALDEGWTDPWMADSTVVGGLIWFFPGLLLKVFKVIGIEPMLLLSTFITRKAFVALYNSCKKPKNKADDISLHKYNNATMSFLQFIEAGITYYSLKAVLMGIFNWKELYFAEFFPISLGIQAFYYIFDMLPTNKYTKRISPVVFLLNSTFNFINFIWTMMAAGTTAGEHLPFTPFISASGIVKGFIFAYMILTTVAFIVRGVLKWKKLLWNNPPDKNKMAITYMHEYSHMAVNSLLRNGQKDEEGKTLPKDLMPKNAISFLTLATLIWILFFWFFMRVLMHYHAGEFN